MQSVHMMDAGAYLGKIVEVLITGAYQNSVSGVVGEEHLSLSSPRRRGSIANI